MSSKGEIVYVLSDTRSGSTLLDQLLGAHTQIVSVGELHWLNAYVRRDRRLYNPVHPLAAHVAKPSWIALSGLMCKTLQIVRLIRFV